MTSTLGFNLGDVRLRDAQLMLRLRTKTDNLQTPARAYDDTQSRRKARELGCIV